MQNTTSVIKPNATLEILGVTEYIEGLSDGIDLLHFPSLPNILGYLIIPFIANLHIMPIAVRLIPFYTGRMVSLVVKMPFYLALVAISTAFPPARLIFKLL